MTEQMFGIVNRVLSIGVAVTLLVLVGKWILTPVAIPEMTVDTVTEIEVMDGATGYAVYISDPEDIKVIVDGFSGVPLKRSGISLLSKTYKYQLTFYGEGGLKVSGFNAFILNEDGQLRRDPFFYQAKEGEVPVEYVDQVVQKTLSGQTNSAE